MNSPNQTHFSCSPRACKYLALPPSSCERARTRQHPRCREARGPHCPTGDSEMDSDAGTLNQLTMQLLNSPTESRLLLTYALKFFLAFSWYNLLIKLQLYKVFDVMI